MRPSFLLVLCAALALGPTGRQVTLVERDASPPEGGADDAFRDWKRNGVGHLRQRRGQRTVEGVTGTGGVDGLYLFGAHAVVRLGIAAQVLVGMRHEHAHRTQRHHHGAGAGELAAQRMQAGTVERGHVES